MIGYMPNCMSVRVCMCVRRLNDVSKSVARIYFSVRVHVCVCVCVRVKRVSFAIELSLVFSLYWTIYIYMCVCM